MRQRRVRRRHLHPVPGPGPEHPAAELQRQPSCPTGTTVCGARRDLPHEHLLLERLLHRRHPLVSRSSTLAVRLTGAHVAPVARFGPERHERPRGTGRRSNQAKLATVTGTRASRCGPCRRPARRCRPPSATSVPFGDEPTSAAVRRVGLRSRSSAEPPVALWRLLDRAPVLEQIDHEVAAVGVADVDRDREPDRAGHAGHRDVDGDAGGVVVGDRRVRGRGELARLTTAAGLAGDATWRAAP